VGKEKKMQAVILAGGKGTRLQPYTTVLPKPLVPIGNYPAMEIVIRQLRFYGVKDIFVSTGHLAGLIEAYFNDGSKYGVKIRYIRENKALSTAGPIGIINGLKDNFLLMNGDVLTDLNYKDLYDFHIKSKSAITIAAVKREILNDFGVLKINRDNNLISYTEKPKRFDYVSIGINVLNKQCIKYISKGEAIGMPDLVRKMLLEKERIRCYKSNSYWLDIGRIEDYQKAQEEFGKNEHKFLHDKK